MNFVNVIDWWTRPQEKWSKRYRNQCFVNQRVVAVVVAMIVDLGVVAMIVDLEVVVMIVDLGVVVAG